jgi:hypothetical protein
LVDQPSDQSPEPEEPLPLFPDFPEPPVAQLPEPEEPPLFPDLPEEDHEEEAEPDFHTQPRSRSLCEVAAVSMAEAPTRVAAVRMIDEVFITSCVFNV